MLVAIKPSNKFGSIFRYIILNRKSKKIKCILKEDVNIELDKEKYFDEKFSEFQVEFVKPLPLKKEIKFIWPQIVEEVNKKFTYLNGWLSRAELQVNERNIITIKVEGKVAWKSLNDTRVKKYLINRISYYLDREIKIEIKNGDFLKSLPESKPDLNRIKKKKVNKTDKKKRGKHKSGSDTNIILGNRIRTEEITPIEEVKHEGQGVVIKGEVFNLEERVTRRGKYLYIFAVTDRSSSITCKFFIDDKSDLKSTLNNEDWVMVKGRVQFDTYSNEIVIMCNSIEKTEAEVRVDTADDKRIELHLHTKMSALDSVVDVEKVIERAAEWGHSAIAITDHGVVQAYPDAYQAGKKHNIKILYGLEAYMVDDGEPIILNPPDVSLESATFVVFDLETTGLNKFKNEIIEIGAVKVKSGKVIDEFSSFVKPGESIPNKITELTGITNEMVSRAPDIEGVIGDFLEFIDGSILVAHNADFDYGFLQVALKKTGQGDISYPVLDTLTLSRALLPDLSNHKLNTLARHLNVRLDNHHRAVEDARATSEIFINFLSNIKNEGIETVPGINRLSTKINWRELPTYHTVIFAKNKQGLKDIYRLVSESHLNYFYRKPRILKSHLIQCRKNLIIGSACEAGQLYRSIINNKPYREIIKIASFYDYLEIQPTGNNKFLVGNKVESIDELEKINYQIYKLGKKLNKPVVATCDVHFLDPEDDIYRKVLQAGQGYDEAEEQAPLYFRTTNEMLEEFSYLGKKAAREVVIENPAKISDQIEELKPLPDGLFAPEIEGANDQIRKMTYQRAHELYGDPLPSIIEERLEKELKAIIDNGYAVIYLISHKLVKKSLEDGYLVGSRGSVGSSLVATMCEITEVNPLPPHYRCPRCKQVEFVNDENTGVGADLPDKNCPHCGTRYVKDGFDIPFEVFMGFEGDKVPDIDLNFSGEYQGEIHKYTEELFGSNYVFRAGTISTIAKRTAFGFVKGYLDDNGLRLNKAEIDRLVKGCTGVKRTTGQHPGGLMVVPKAYDIHDFSPIQRPANDQETDVITTHFDYHSISGRILKLDLLGHDDPTTIRMLQDLTGVNPHDIPLDDPDTMDIFSSTDPLGVSPEEIGTVVGTLGIPEFGTSFVRQMLVDTRPTTFAELVRISGLSHGTDVWLNNAQDLIKSGKARLSEVISVRDDIMNYLIQKGLEPGKSFWIMEHVRKGKGLTEEEEQYMREHNVPDWYIESCKKIKYMFPKAHAAAYVMMAFRIAYFKVHYPEAFYTTYFTIKADDFDAHMINQGYDHIIEVKKNLEARGNDMTAKEKGILTVLEIVIEAMARGIEFLPVDLYKSDATKFKLTDKGLLPPLVSLQGLGSSAAEKIAVTRQEAPFSSVEDLVNRTRISKTVVEILEEHGSLDGLPERDQLSLFN
ncbi:PolC-type DNA polymerase III [Halothermothrix orenii]|uniref:DNA polymerase III PolC-type n=1 Tax=Halothermothrix orenii (strain H 168 / OCM 544 / DSM 9562) TaxID=373903 RepID=B8CW68_HALOH|nr:PolC-type DNA polymerase III [Halothermothrix orenii]ACL69537.1 DNA polymerase III, alpha subunit [Halothermothrix orenii H 168]